MEVDVRLEDGSFGRNASASGTSWGRIEAFDLRDGDASYCNGLEVTQAIANVNTTITDGLQGMDATDQAEIDRWLIELDGTANKSRLGGNAIIATSIATAKAAAQSVGLALYEHLDRWRGRLRQGISKEISK